MPPRNGGNNNGTKKKKKGRAPAHQNAFAFRHNPKSKLTAKIMESPNVGVCRRCHDKIEWRKKYRKYKPLTQPGKCNLCSRRNVKAAYHTICTSCASSDKTFSFASKADDAKPINDGTAAVEIVEERLVADGTESNVSRLEHDSHDEVQVSPESSALPLPTETAGRQAKARSLRMCAVCVKQPALPDPDADGPEEKFSVETGRMTLRERRALERKLAREEEGGRRGTGEASEIDGREEEEEDEKSEVELDSCGDDDNEEDPFLRAVGGSDKLLTGEAYRKMLMEREGLEEGP